MIIIKTTLSSFNCLQIFEKHKKKRKTTKPVEKPNEIINQLYPRNRHACPPSPAALPFPDLIYIHTTHSRQSTKQEAEQERKKERQSKRYRWIVVEIYFPSICVGETALKRSRGRDISRAYWITARIREAEGESERERKKKRHKRTLNLHKINYIIVYCLFYRFVYKKC